MFHPRTAVFLLTATLLTACGDGTSHTSIITSGNSSLFNGGINLSHDEVTLHVRGVPNAVIDQAGNFTIEQKPVALEPAQRELLQDYYRNTVAVREHGIATGKTGIAIAGKAIGSVARGLANGNTDDIGKDVEAKASAITQEVHKICDDMANIKVAQDHLATRLPAFKPYAGIVDDSTVADCRQHDSDD